MQKKQIHHRTGPLYCGATLIGVILLVVFRLLPGHHFGVYAMGEGKYHERNGIHTRCSFFDTVDLTDSPSFKNGSYSYKGVLIPSHEVGTFDYIYKHLGDRVDVPEHKRACICKIKSCINICCPWGQIYRENGCEVDTSTKLWPEKIMNVTLNNGSIQTVDIEEKFVVQSFRPCTEMFALQPELSAYDTYQLYENGSLLREDDMLYIHKDEFCLVPTYVNDTDIYYTINPANCNMLSVSSTVKIINGYAMLFSIPFMLLTIAVYLLIPELRNQHGKSLVCYLLGISIGYSLLCCLLLLKNIHPNGLPCKLFGYTTYFFFMSAFFWLNVISFDLWHNIRGTRGINPFQEKKRFLLYSLYSWGSALAFLVFTVLAQEYSDWPTELKPGIGGGELCWLEMRNWSAMLYFFGPIMLIIVANTIMFVMTAFRIHSVQREIARIIAREDNTRHLRTEKDKFGLFLRLFLIMGVTWSSEIISYFVGADKKWSKIFYVSDLCNAMQGFLIFMLFVLKKKVKHLITNRCSRARDGSNQRQSQYSTKTTSSSVANLSLQEKPLVSTVLDQHPIAPQQEQLQQQRPPKHIFKLELD